MQRTLQRHNIVLLGAGHTNAHIMRMWRMRPLPEANLICVSDFPFATYSGMLPAVLAGQCGREAMEIDLVRFCQASGIRLIVDRVTGIDTDRRRLKFADRPALYYDWLSVGIGSKPNLDGLKIDESAPIVAIKPMQTFLRRLESALDTARAHIANAPTVSIIGGGAGGIEVAFALRRRLNKRSGFHDSQIRIVAGNELGEGLATGTRKAVLREFAKAGVDVVTGNRVRSILDKALVLENDHQLPSDLNIIATGAVAGELLRHIPLEHDKRGFLLTRSTLQTLDDDRVFAVGDSGTLAGEHVPKAGVHAVRQGPILWQNLIKSLQGKSLTSYSPQRGFLKLINLGDDRAIAEYRGLSASGWWAWKLKHRIDSRFMEMYQEYKPVSDSMSGASEPADSDTAMRCLGCGGKVGGLALREALAGLADARHERILVGVQDADDAAVIRTTNNQVTVTTDFFAAPFDDPYTFGRITAINSASDCFSMNARPMAALSLLQIPFGHPRVQSEVLGELTAGAQREFERMGAGIAGGHTIEGPRLAAGFTVLADQEAPMTGKSGLRQGDLLVTTKALGTGVLLAGLMRGQCRYDWFQTLIESMLGCNSVALALIKEFRLLAMTDITGFGLAGHLQEMLNASKVSAELWTDALACLPGVDVLMKDGVASTLSPENERLVVATSHSTDLGGLETTAPRSGILFDPQTSGGLLFGIAEQEADRAIRFLKEHGFPYSTVIGVVTDSDATGHSRLIVRNAQSPRRK